MIQLQAFLKEDISLWFYSSSFSGMEGQILTTPFLLIVCKQKTIPGLILLPEVHVCVDWGI